MKRIISNILTLAFLLLGMTACQVETISADNDNENGGEKLTFSFKTRAVAADGTQIDSETELNEDKIETLDLFFFNEDGTGTYKAHHQYTNDNSNKNTTYTVNVNSKGLDVTGNTRYLVYAVVNRVITKETTPNYTLAQLKALAANKTITTDDSSTTDVNENVQQSFVMDGEIVTTLSSTTTPKIELSRSVAKITLDINVAEEIFVGSNKIKYTPILETMTVKLVNGVKNGIINGFGTADYFETTTSNPTTRSISEVEDGNDCTPFYSYPYNWSSTNKDCHLYLSIQWASELGGLNTYYYIVPIGEVTELIRNNHYKINLDVAILGGTEEDPVTLNANYIIENWSTCEISTELKKYKYLWVKGREFVMNNVEEISIEFASSSSLIIKNKSVKRYFAGADSDKEILNNITENTNIVSITENSSKGTIDITHQFSNSDDTKEQNYYRPWYIEFDVYNQEGLFIENIEVVQYPAIYIVADYNAANNSDNTSNGNRNRFVNGNKNGYTDNNTDLGRVTDIANYSGDTNRNRNQYTIHVTRLGKEYDYLIGDPRNLSINNGNGVKYEDLSGGESRCVTNYYPTKTSTDVNNMISPVYRIASSWGVTYDISYENAQKRCASYQENGYPAGRWRIPTEAEIQFIVDLSPTYIPTLFSGEYWAASGRYYSSKNNKFGNASEEYAVRCIYDEWYWGENKIEKIYDFTWGDEIIK